MRFINFFLSSLVLSIPLLGYAECVNIKGVSFEKISSNKLLAIQGGKNIAIITTGTPLPDKIAQFRFFSDQLCNFGAESKFHIDEKLVYVDYYGIEVFK